jgi:hypothetical protein
MTPERSDTSILLLGVPRYALTSSLLCRLPILALRFPNPAYISTEDPLPSPRFVISFLVTGVP